MPLHAALQDFPQSQQETFCDCLEHGPAEPGAVLGAGRAHRCPSGQLCWPARTADGCWPCPGELHQALQTFVKHSPKDPAVPGEEAEKRLICLLDRQKLAR